jgi:hypothetical protein
MHHYFYLQQDSFGQAEFHDMMAIKKLKVIKIQDIENIGIHCHHKVQ